METPKNINQLITNINKATDNNAMIVYTSIPHLYQQIDHLNRKSTTTNNSGFERHIVPDGSNKYIQNISFYDSRIHILFKSTQNILQKRSPIRPQNKSQQVQKRVKSYHTSSLTTYCEIRNQLQEGHLGGSVS